MQYGDIIELGRHRLMCGNSCKREDIDKLIEGYKIDFILTDPPYGMKAQHNNGCIGGGSPLLTKKRLRPDLITPSQKYPLLIGDNNQDAARINYELTKDLSKYQIIFGGQYFANFLPVNGGWIFWDKLNGASDFSDGELAWRSWGKKVCKYSHKWNGICRAGNQKLNGKTRCHPTQKPVELLANILEDFCVKDGIVLDCFGGSGSTLIACEITGRTCLMMELSPEYCDIIAERYKNVKENYSIS